MNPRELVDHIRSGPAQLVLNKPLRFRRRTRSNSCDFNEFLQALQSSETIRSVEWKSHTELGITEDEWVLLLKTLGSIRDIRSLKLSCLHNSRNFDPFQTLAEAVNNAHSLRELQIVQQSRMFPRDSSGLTALANALQEHTTLEKFTWLDWFSPRAPQDLTLDPVFRTLSACLHLRKVVIMTKKASLDATKSLLQLMPTIDLRLLLDAERWLAVADEIRRGRCNVQRLTLVMIHGDERSKASEAVQAVLRAIRVDSNLEHLALEMGYGFTNEAGVALAESLTVNTTLRMISLNGSLVYDELGAPTYEAISAMLRVNTSLVLKLPPFKNDGADATLLESRNQMVIEQRLNQVGRGKLLAPRLTTREVFIDALHELGSYDLDESPAFQVSCLYTLLRLNPSVICVS
jgi:hypothetical protein